MDDDDRVARNRVEKSARQSRPKPYERSQAGRQKEGLFKRLSDVFTSVPYWLKEKLSPVKVTNGTAASETEESRSNHVHQNQSNAETASAQETAGDQQPLRNDVFHTPPATSASEEQCDSDADDNGSTSTSACSSMMGDGELHESRVSALAVPLNHSLQSVALTRPRLSFKTLDLNRKRRNDPNESAESSVNVSRSPSLYTEDSERGGSLNLGSKRARLNLSTATMPGMSRDSSPFSRLSRDEMFQSPFYPGRTTYGGASAYRFDASRPFRTHVISVKSRVKPAEKPRPMTAMTKRIYEALESLAPPPALETPKKQPQTPSASGSMTGLFTGFSTTIKTPGPPVKILKTPRPARVVFPPLKPMKMPEERVEQPPLVPKFSVTTTPSSFGKMVTKITDTVRRRPTMLGEKAERKRLIQEEEEPAEVPDLPQISLPSLAFKPISLGVTVPDVAPVSQFSFAPGRELGAGKEVSSSVVTFKFESGVNPLVSSVTVKSGAGAKWECPTCMVRNESDKDTCPCCLTKKPAPKQTIKPKLGLQAGANWTCLSCSLVNETDRNKCKSCQKPKLGSVSTPSTVQSTWKCKECLTSHTSDVKKCPACEVPREQARASAQSPAPLSILDMFKPKPGAWRCTTCDVSNDAENSKCCSCSSPRAVPSVPKTMSKLPPLSAVDSLKPKSGSWNCQECFVSNTAERNACVACATPKPGSLPASKPVLSDVFKPAVAPSGPGSMMLNELFKPKAGSWKCNVCDVSNDSDKTACVACATAKPGAEKTSSFGGFKFGASADKTESPAFQFGIPSSLPVGAPASGIKFGVTPQPEDGLPKFSFGMPATSEAVTSGGKRKLNETPADSYRGDLAPKTVSDNNANIVRKTALKRPEHPLGAEPSVEVFPVKSVAPSFSTFSFGAKPKSDSDLASGVVTKGPEEKPLKTSASFTFGTSEPKTDQLAPSITFGPVDTSAVKPVEAKVTPAAVFGGLGTTAPSTSLFQFGSAQKMGTEQPASKQETVQTSAPQASFGGFGASTESKSSLFSFGAPLSTTPATVPTTEKPISTFAFGAPAKTESSLSTFAFGGPAPSIAPAAVPTTFGAPISTSAPPPYVAPSTAQPLFGTSAPSVGFGGFGTSTASTPSLVFGSGGSFGAVASTASPVFGMEASTFGTTPTFGGISTAAPTFGASTTSTPAASFGTFGGTASESTFGGVSFGASKPAASAFEGFGASAPVTSAPAFGSFGSVASTQSSMFGAPTPAFGAAGSVFGTAPSTTTSTFGSQSVFGSTPGFGTQPAPAFGAAPTVAFGAAPTRAVSFGAAPSTNQGFSFQPPSAGMSFAFGGQQQPSRQVFGASSTPSPAFGASPAPAFGASSTPAPAFGASSTPAPAFGASVSTAPVFGASSLAPTFGTAPTQATSGAFGAPQQQTSQAFSSTPSFNFGQSGSAFQAQAPAFNFGATQGAPTGPANPFDAAANPRSSSQPRVIRKANRRIQRP